jgi:hypothetical protein
MVETAIFERAAVVRHGRRLEYFTIGWNALEGLVAVVAGAIAGSISLVGFGIDSFIEVTSGSVLLWRMSVDAEVHRRELNERRALRIVGVCFLLLAAYITYESALDLWSRRAPEHSIPGIVLACVSLVVMPFFPEPSERWELLSAVPPCTRTPNKQSFARTCPPSCWPDCCSTPCSVYGGPTRRRPSSWFRSSQKKESKDRRATPATNAARDNYFFGSSSDIVGASPV